MIKGYFDREQKIKTHEQMVTTLKQHVAAHAPAKLKWLEPVRNKDGSGHQVAAGTGYEIRKTLSNKQWMYWAWHDKRLLGYSPDVDIARNHCEAHYLQVAP